MTQDRRVVVAEGIHRRTLGVANWYLVEEQDRLTIVDAGTPADWRLLLDGLAELGRSLGDVEAILLTHAHSDHTGFAERARSEAGARVLVHEEDADRARGAEPPKNEAGLGRYLLRLEAYRTGFALMRQGASKVIPIAEVSTYRDGEVIDVPGRPRAIHAPGHTEGNCALWLEGRGVLCSGDTIVTRNPMTGRRGPQIMPASFNLDSRQALDSLSALEQAYADVLLPGHGEPWREGVAQAVRAARAAGPS